MSKSTNSKHVVARIPLTIRYQIKQLALIALDRLLSLFSCIPDIWLTIFRARYKVQAIWRNSTSNHQIFTLCSKKSFLNSRTLSIFVLNKPYTIVSRLNKQLLFTLGMHDDLVNLITQKLFMPNFEKILNLTGIMTQLDIKTCNRATRITDKESSRITEAKTVRVCLIENCSLDSLFLRLSIIQQRLLLLNFSFICSYWVHDSLEGFIIQLISLKNGLSCTKIHCWFSEN